MNIYFKNPPKTARIAELRFVFSEAHTDCYVLIEDVAGMPPRLLGWHHKRFPYPGDGCGTYANVNVENGIIQRIANRDDDPIGWPMQDPERR